MSDEVRREVELPASAEDVWDALTDPERLAGWLADAVEVELEPGGELSMRTLEGERRTGWVEHADAPRRLSFWWRADGDEETSRVEVLLEPSEEGTRVTVVETRPLAVVELRGLELSARHEIPGHRPLALAA